MNVTSLQELVVPLPNAEAQAQARARQDRLTKPAGSLGRLEEISIWLAGVHGVNPPRAINDPHLVILAGDHGITEAGVSAFPAEVTRQMVHNFVAGGAAATVLARAYDVDVSVFDISVNAPAETFPESVTRYKVSSGSSRCDTGAAISMEEASAAFFAGRQIAHDLGDSGVDLLLTGDMGIGNTTIASLISSYTKQMMIMSGGPDQRNLAVMCDDFRGWFKPSWVLLAQLAARFCKCGLQGAAERGIVESTNDVDGFSSSGRSSTSKRAGLVAGEPSLCRTCACRCTSTPWPGSTY